MWRVLPLLLLAGCVAGGGGGPPGGRCEGVLRVSNGAAMAVEQLYVSGAGPASWGQDRLAPNILPPGGVLEARTGPEPQSVRVVFVDGSAIEMAGLEVCATPILRVGPRTLQPER
jgi:hypothetical protein